MAAFTYKQLGVLRTVFCLLMTVFSMTFAGLAMAQPNPVYTVEGVEVDITAKNAVEARQQALDEAQVKAYQMLAERLLSPEDLKNFQAPDANTVSLLVQDYEVTNEQLSKVRYKGTFTIRFRPNAMKSQMASQGRVYSDVQQKPLLVLPFYQDKGQSVLWGDTNPWMSAWRTVPADQESLQPIAVPLGDAADVADIGDEDAQQYDPMKVQELATRYGADDAVIVVANTEPGEGGKVLIVNIYKHGFSGPEFVQKISLQQQPGETDDALMSRAVTRVKGLLRQDWKNNAAYVPPTSTATTTTIVQPMGQAPATQPYPVMPQQAAGPAYTYNCYARFATVQDWVRLKGSLDRTPGVQVVLVKTLKPHEALLDVRFAGNINQLQASLQNAGIMMHASSESEPIELYMNGLQAPYGR